MQAPGEADEDPSGGFDQGGWLVPFADEDMMRLVALNTLPKYVASQTLRQVEWNNARLIRGDVVEEIARLKRQPGGELQVHGSGGLAQTLIERDLVDLYRLWSFPVVLGRGKRLFGRGTVPTTLSLVDTRTTSAGVAIHTYERAGKMQCGSVEATEWQEELRQRSKQRARTH